ncbi:MAG: hypothetical protein QF570_19230 [Myxococcota bacterium]|nr:hypothetical protein [Myxococcota bacterium]
MSKTLTTMSLILTLALTAPVAALADAEADAKQGKSEKTEKTGKELFESAEGGSCSTCHHTTNMLKVGPGLLDVSKRHTDEWLTMWLKDPQGTWRSEHPETLELRERTRKLRSRATSCVKKPMDDETRQKIVDYMGTLLSTPAAEPTK